MTLRDLGYKPYDGPRLPPSSSTWVIYRYGIRRALDSTTLKLLLGVSIFPGLVAALIAFIALRFSGDIAEFELDSYISFLFGLQTWFFVGLASLLVGSTAIAEDLQAHAFPIFFAKPLTPIQYLVGRVLAIGTLLFTLSVTPGVILVFGFAATAPAGIRGESIGFILPVLAHAIIVASACACASVGLSATTRNRAITMSLFMVLWLVPGVVAKVVHLATGQAWLNLISIPNLLGVLGDALLKKDMTDQLAWYWALLALVVYAGAGLFFAQARLNRAEVVS
jgi:ABC-2 type transport system permease protein